MLQKKQNAKWNNRILSELGKTLLKKIFRRHIECIRNSKLIKKIIIKNCLKIALKR
jgi:S-adenosylmethionine/arginine decarboxylase-like enzyme